MRLAAVCAIYGGYDLIPPVPEGVDDAVLVTDVPVRSGWRNVVDMDGLEAVTFCFATASKPTSTFPPLRHR